MSIKPDHWIRKMALEHRMIDPFVDRQVREGVISYGLSSYGYDIRIADEFRIFTSGLGDLTVVDPKHFDARSMVDFHGDVCVIPPNSFALARTIEYLRMPRAVLGVVLGKSTYARCGIITNFTPLEPCFSADTEILTPIGWRFLEQIQTGDLVMGMTEQGCAEYQPVLAKQTYDFSGELMHFAGKSVDLLITPDHKLLVNRRTNGRSTRRGLEKTGWHTEDARCVFGHYNFEMTRQVIWTGKSTGDTLSINGVQFPTSAFLRFLGIWLGDGSAYPAKKKGETSGYVVQIAAFNHKRAYVKDVLDELGVTYSEYKEGFRFFSKPMYEYLAPYRLSENKRVPREWLELAPNYLALLLEGLMVSDGNEETQTITTTSRQLADDIQVLAFLSGQSAIVRALAPNPKARQLNGVELKSIRTVYKVRLSTRQMTPKSRPSTHSLVPYEGKVFDVTVPNHLIFVRRNGKAVWSGNCWEGHITIEISNTTPLPAKIYANEGIAQVLFFEGDPPEQSYADKKGKYQGQVGITLPRL